MGNSQTFTSCSRPQDRKVSNIPQHEFLSEKQKTLAHSTWLRLCRMSGPTHRGMRVFTRIFEYNPETKMLFPFRNLDNEALWRNALFKGHATRFMKAVEFTMQNLDALDVIVNPTLISIGNKHVHIKGFHPDYLDVFQMALLDIWEEDLGKRFVTETREAWSKIFGLITRKVYEGYMEEQTRMNAHITSSCDGPAVKLPHNGVNSANNNAPKDQVEDSVTQEQPVMQEDIGDDQCPDSIHSPDPVPYIDLCSDPEQIEVCEAEAPHQEQQADGSDQPVMAMDSTSSRSETRAAITASQQST